MKLMTNAIKAKAQKQYAQASSMEQNIVAKFFDPCGSWSWYVMNQDPEDPDYLWGIVKGVCVETGSFSLSDLSTYKGPLDLGIERDMHFKPRKAQSVLDDLENGVHV